MSRPAQRRHRYTYAEYLDHDTVSSARHEFLDGDIYAMAGGTPEHAALCTALATVLSNLLDGGPCHVFSSDLRVRVLATGLAAYPDLTVICGPIERDPESRVTVTNPTLVVEVLSDGTEDWDRSEKLEHYRQIPTLSECLLVSHREPRFELWRREGDGRWTCLVAGAGEKLSLDSLRVELDINDIYRRGRVDG